MELSICGRLVAELSGRARRNVLRSHADGALWLCRELEFACVLELWLPGARVCPAYDGGVKQIPCVCGRVVKGEDDDELWQNAQEHLREDHPDLVGKVSREDLLAQAEEVTKPSS